MKNEQNTPTSYDAVLTQLLAQRDDLDKAIAAISRLAGKEVPDSSSKIDADGNKSTGTQIKGDSFFGLTVPDAIRKLLGMRRQPLTPAEIAQSLEEGGITHSSASFINTVGSVLHRLAKVESGIVQVKRGQYGLVEWYPGFKRSKAGGKKNEEAEEIDTDKSGKKSVKK